MTSDSAPAKSDLASKIEQKTAIVGVIGLGYVGLPLVKAFVEAGFKTIGFDVDPSKIDRLKAAESYIAHIQSQWLAECIAQERFEPTADMARLGEADALLICVPTPLSDSRDPDLQYVVNTTEMIARTLRKDQIVILESTTYPGTTRDVVLPILAKSGLIVGQDFFLSYSPEREDPGNKQFSAKSIPKVIGGYCAESQSLAASLYGHAVVQTVDASSLEVAEACKILENIYRAVNIALINELKVLFSKLGIDVWEVIEAAKTKPFGFQAFYPGPGLGGHCIPIDPFYLTWLARKHEMSTRFIELAGEVNASMPEYVVQQVIETLNSICKSVRNSRIGILGMAYKKDIDDPRESPSFKIMELLLERGGILSYNDPHIAVLPKMRHYDMPRLTSEPLTSDWLSAQDVVIIATDHSAYDFDFIVKHSNLVVDTRNATKDVTESRDRIFKA